MSIIQQALNSQQSHLQKIRNAKYKIEQIKVKHNSWIFSVAISNNLEYIIVGESDCELSIWKYRTNNRIRSLRFNYKVSSCKFTQDSRLLYVGIDFRLYQFYVNSKFKKLCRQDLQDRYAGCIRDIYCISNTIILTSISQLIIKTDVNKKQQLLKINTINNHSCGFDYNKSLNLIASGSAYGSIILWNGHDGSLKIEKQQANNLYKRIYQVLFLINTNQLTSLDVYGNMIIWNINYQLKQLELFVQIDQAGANISLALQQQYIITTGRRLIKIFTIQGEFIRQLDHQLENILFYDAIQHDSMKAILIKGRDKLCICKVELD